MTRKCHNRRLRYDITRKCYTEHRQRQHNKSKAKKTSSLSLCKMINKPERAPIPYHKSGTKHKWEQNNVKAKTGKGHCLYTLTYSHCLIRFNVSNTQHTSPKLHTRSKVIGLLVLQNQFFSLALAICESWALFFVSSWSVNLIRVFSMMIHCIS